MSVRRPSVTIQDLGSLGELIAAVATVITLAYLALQIRQNTQAMRNAATRAIIEDSNGWRANVLQNSEVAELYQKGMLDPDSMDRAERFRFRMLIDSLFDSWQYVFQYAPDALQNQRRYVEGTLARPGGAQYWARERDRFEPEFVAWIDGAVSSPHETGGEAAD